MKFLDSNGLTYFWNKIKTWAGNNYLSLKGGSIDGSVVINNEESVALRVLDGSSYSDEEVTISPTRITMSHTDEDLGGGSSVVYNLDIQDGNITAESFTRIGGTATQVLIANGSVKGIGSANGVAGLDSKGYVPLSQLGNLDTTVAEVVTALPTTNIKKHIYLVKDASGVTQNQYEEYLYTGDTSAAYDASKWEKLGDFRATVDLADYAKKNDAVNFHTIRWSSEIIDNTQTAQITKQSITFQNLLGESTKISFKDATNEMAGFMSIEDKKKLNTIEPNANHYTLPFAANNTLGGIKLGYPETHIGSGRNYPLYVNSEAKAYVTISMASPKTYGEGLMTGEDKTKLDGISSGATADSAITTEEIDALFA